MESFVCLLLSGFTALVVPCRAGSESSFDLSGLVLRSHCGAVSETRSQLIDLANCGEVEGWICASVLDLEQEGVHTGARCDRIDSKTRLEEEAKSSS